MEHALPELHLLFFVLAFVVTRVAEVGQASNCFSRTSNSPPCCRSSMTDAAVRGAMACCNRISETEASTFTTKVLKVSATIGQLFRIAQNTRDAVTHIGDSNSRHQVFFLTLTIKQKKVSEHALSVFLRFAEDFALTKVFDRTLGHPTVSFKCFGERILH
jgi:hypothetical protein